MKVGAFRRAAAAAAVACVLGACHGGGTPDEPADGASETPSESASAAAVGEIDAAANAVPLAGTEDVHVDWYPDSLEAGSDPVVEVARRYELLFLLGHYEPGWASQSQLDSYVEALSMPGVVRDESFDYWLRDEATQPGTIKVLMSEPERGTDGTARVFACLDSRDILGGRTAGPTVEFDLKLDDSHWRVSHYEVQNPNTPPAFFDECRDGEWTILSP